VIPITKHIIRTRVVSRNAIIDWFQQLRNLFGWRLRGYEEILQANADELVEDIRAEYDFSGPDCWWKLEVDPLTTGSAIVMVYGEGELR